MPLEIKFSKKRGRKAKKSYAGLIALVAIFTVAMLGVSVTKASEGTFSWKSVENKVATMLFGEVGTPEPMSIGAAGDTYSTQKQASIVLSTTASTTMAALYNNSGSDWIIEKAEIYVEGSDGTDATVGRIFEISTSTDAFTSSTNPIYSQTFTTSTIVSINASSTYFIGNEWRRKVANGEYITFQISNTVSTTDGVAVVEYYKY